MRYVTAKNKWNYWKDLEAIRCREHFEFEYPKLAAYTIEHFGFQILTNEQGITDTYAVVDEAKYLLWLLKKN